MLGCESEYKNGSEIPQDGESAPVTTYPSCDAVNYERTCREEDGTIYYVEDTEDDQVWMELERE